MYVTIENLYADLERSLEALRTDASAVRRSRAVVEAALGDGGTYYGINTGFGKLAQVRIPPEQQTRLQPRRARAGAAIGSRAPGRP